MSIRTETYDVVVIGSGAAGFNAANRIRQLSEKSVCILTEGVNMGTSRNTGSDKQTYYKLGLGGDAPDSVRKMAADLFACGSVDGDTALCEAAFSARSFLNLCELGVRFPHNRYGEYIGYKTDHDPYARATSTGPLTSKDMTEALEKQAHSLAVPIYDGVYALEILTDDARKVCGVLVLEKERGELVAFRCGAVILCTGGPAGVYADSVYPQSQTGSTGLALLCGAPLQNMTEWQYGLASTEPRWNVSGTYMQVLPRFVSVDENGTEYEFLSEYFEDEYEALSMIFLKGYQWPFDCKKAMDGSSRIDLAVYRETAERRRAVYLDFTKNPFGMEKIDFSRLKKEAYDYLQKAGALLSTPIARLERMNRPAIDLYLGKGRDITKEYLPIALCAQHNNGGIAVDLWWQTEIKGLFAAGECAGTHGVTRPGGSALNAGQVGSLRAAMRCAAEALSVDEDAFSAAVTRRSAFYESVICNSLHRPDTVEAQIELSARRMSEVGGVLRSPGQMAKLLAETKTALAGLFDRVGTNARRNVYRIFVLRSMLLTQSAMLTAMCDYAEKIGKSRGSALYTDESGQAPHGLGEVYRFTCETNGASFAEIQQVSFDGNDFRASWRKVRPMPGNDDFFENVWRQYRENGNID